MIGSVLEYTEQMEKDLNTFGTMPWSDYIITKQIYDVQLIIVKREDYWFFKYDGNPFMERDKFYDFITRYKYDELEYLVVEMTNFYNKTILETKFVFDKFKKKDLRTDLLRIAMHSPELIRNSKIVDSEINQIAEIVYNFVDNEKYFK